MTFLPLAVKNLPLKRKLLLAFMTTSITSLTLVCIIFLINDYLNMRKGLLDEAVALTDTLANTSTAAIAFADRHGANEILLALKAHPHIDMAALYLKDGTEIAFYRRNGVSGRPLLSELLNGQIFHKNSIHISRAINLGTEQIGRIYLRYDLSTRAYRQLRFIYLIFFVLMLVSCCSYIVASRLMRYISKPVQNLVDVAQAVSESGDYNIRAVRYHPDEIGTLADSFNNMLTQIQERDRQLAKYHARLEEQVEKRTLELEATNAQLVLEISERTKAEQARSLMEDELLKSRKLESIGVLAGGIAHDFNNILTAVVGFISLVRYRTKDNEKVQDFLINAENGCFRAKDLTRQLLTFSRGGKPVRKNTSLVSVIQEAVSISMAGSNVLSKVKISDKLKQVYIDTGQIVQVFNNLLINACQAMPNGGLVNVRADNIIIESDAPFPLLPGEYVKIEFEDFGCGIVEENLHRIFDPYFSTKPMGNGLGLATSYSIIKNHGGMILVASKPGNGSTFTVYLPAAHSDVVRDHEYIETQPSAGAGTINKIKRVLVMDDDEMIRKVTGEMLSSLGYSVALACDGDEAIAMYREAGESGTCFDIVIMDLTIPGGKGAVAAAAKLLEYDRKACVFVSSGYADEPAIADYHAYGFRGGIAKPYTLDELEKILKSS